MSFRCLDQEWSSYYMPRQVAALRAVTSHRSPQHPEPAGCNTATIHNPFFVRFRVFLWHYFCPFYNPWPMNLAMKNQEQRATWVVNCCWLMVVRLTQGLKAKAGRKMKKKIWLIAGGEW